MRVEFINEAALETVNQWLAHHGFQSAIFEAFPPNTFVVYENGQALAVGSVYMTDTPLCYIDNIVSNPEIGDVKRARAVKFLVDNLMAAAKFNGKKWWAASSKERSIGKWVKKYELVQKVEGHTWYTGGVKCQ